MDVTLNEEVPLKVWPLVSLVEEYSIDIDENCLITARAAAVESDVEVEVEVHEVSEVATLVTAVEAEVVGLEVEVEAEVTALEVVTGVDIIDVWLDVVIDSVDDWVELEIGVVTEVVVGVVRTT